MAIAGDDSNALALRDDGTVTRWGSDGTDTPAIDGGAVQDPGDDGGPMAVPERLDRVVAIAAGGLFYLALRDNGTVTAWGYNRLGQTTVPASTTSLPSPPASTTA